MIQKSMLNVLRDPDPPTNEGGGVPPSTATPSQQSPPSQLNSDQQKVAAALDKAAANEPAPAKQPKVHKNIFTPPPGEVLEKDFSLGDDSEVVEGDSKPAVKVEDTTKDNTKPPAQQQQQKPPQQKPTPQKATDVKVKAGDSKPFDYSGFAIDEINALKQMSTQAKEVAAKAFRELKELKGKAPDVYYQHEEGYTLDPKYRELSQTIDFTNREAEHWKQQLLAVRQGKPWTLLKGFDDKGNPIIEGPFKATDEADINIANALQVVSGQLGQMQQQKAQYGQQYQQRVKQDNAILQAEMANRFDWVKDPTKLEQKVDIGGKVGEVTIKQMQQDFKGLFASYHQGNPVLDMAANMFVALQIYGARIRELEGTNQHQERLKEDILSSEPTLETKQGNGKPDGVEFSLEGLPD